MGGREELHEVSRLLLAVSVMAVALRCPFREVRARARPLLALLVVATAGMALLGPSGLLRFDGVLAVFVMQRSRLGRAAPGRPPA
ncbi:hypothetical protein ACPC37_09205 [Streptomyces griseoincarnatus]